MQFHNGGVYPSSRSSRHSLRTSLFRKRFPPLTCLFLAPLFFPGKYRRAFFFPTVSLKVRCVFPSFPLSVTRPFRGPIPAPPLRAARSLFCQARVLKALQASLHSPCRERIATTFPNFSSQSVSPGGSTLRLFPSRSLLSPAKFPVPPKLRTFCRRPSCAWCIFWFLLLFSGFTLLLPHGFISHWNPEPNLETRLPVLDLS